MAQGNNHSNNNLGNKMTLSTLPKSGNRINERGEGGGREGGFFTPLNGKCCTFA